MALLYRTRMNDTGASRRFQRSHAHWIRMYLRRMYAEEDDLRESVPNFASPQVITRSTTNSMYLVCLLYTSDAADE